MPKTSPADFKIHVDPSCLTDSSESDMSPETEQPAERIPSNQTIIHHDISDSVTEEEKVDVEQKVEDEETQDDEDDRSEKARERQLDRIEAQIQAAARAVVASIENDNYRGNGSVLSVQTDEGYEQENSQLTYEDGTAHIYGEGTELTYDGTEGTYETETEDEHHEQGGEGSSSSNHDGDIDDDVFSSSGHSKRSSLNSCNDMTSSDDAHGKALTSPTVGEEAASQPVSRIPSTTSYTDEPNPITPSRVLARPPFRTPSSVRAIQMSSPTPSIFSSPRSTKRYMPTVSRIGTPSSPFSQSKKTPTRFKTKKENPLVLLHVTVLPLAWNYSHMMTSADLPPTLQKVRDNWRLLQGQLGEAVLERGILLPHPQDDYEVLEERLLEALELPVRPRARILKCGHYMGPETPTSDEEGREQYFQGNERKWCDICGRDVKYEQQMSGSMERRFRVKIYASNGLMRAGAWAACWREMERVDVELEPYVEGDLAVELENLASSSPPAPVAELADEDEFVDEEEELEQARKKKDLEEEQISQEEEQMRRKIMEEERLREIYGHDKHAPLPEQQHNDPQAQAPRHGDSLPELLLAAFKVAMKDTKNVAIVVLSVLVFLLALKPRGVVMINQPVTRQSSIANEVAREMEPAMRDVPHPQISIESPEPVKPVDSIVVPEAVERVTVPAPEVVKQQVKELPLVQSQGVETRAQQFPQPKHEVEPRPYRIIAPHAVENPTQDINPSVPYQAPALEIDATESTIPVVAEHNDPDLKEVVPV